MTGVVGNDQHDQQDSERVDVLASPERRELASDVIVCPAALAVSATKTCARYSERRVESNSAASSWLYRWDVELGVAPQTRHGSVDGAMNRERYDRRIEV
jgi:hypothetical protein